MSVGEIPSDEGYLGESTYEFIDTDTESRDDNKTESVASTDFGRPDDVASLADTEESGDDEVAGTSSIPALPVLDDTVEQAFNTPTIGRSSHIIVDDVERLLTQSIEFEETFGLGAETVSVKHTVSELNEEQTIEAFKGMALQSPPKRVVVTIRQTMTKQGLSTKDPLRILYVGSHSARQDIIHKIASCVTASVDNGGRSQNLRHLASQLYNVVPVSEFGSDSTPEIELMYSSGFQIKVEDCVSAQTLKYEDDLEKPDVVKLTIGENFAYHSVPDKDGFSVEPEWELPHVAVFYCSDNDDAQAKQTRTLARKFMSRHFVPSVVITHRQLFDKGPCVSLDQHSIHMCLESRDTSGRGIVIHQRLPIDLASFLNIDARQMNRNMAYLTGLNEQTQSRTPSPLAKSKMANTKIVDQSQSEKSAPFSMTGSIKSIGRNPAQWKAVLPFGVMLLSILIGVYAGIEKTSQFNAPAVLLNSKVVSPVSISSTTSSSLSTIAMKTTTLCETPTSISTSASTITVTKSSLPHGPNSLSKLPSMKLGTIPKAARSSKSPKKSVCTAEILGDKGILIRIPSATKLPWQNTENIFVNISRNKVLIDSESAYHADEGVVLLLPKSEAYGVLNVTIITTKKPRVNETFQLDFGTTPFRAWMSLKNPFPSLTNLTQLRKKSEKMAMDAYQESQSVLTEISQFGTSAIQVATNISTDVVHVAKQASLEVAKNSAIISKEVGIRATEAGAALSDIFGGFSLRNVKAQSDRGVLAAQVNSKILWLKLQGKDNEAKDYERKAVEAMKLRTMRKGKEGRKKLFNTLRETKAMKKDTKKIKKGGKKSKVSS